MLGLCEPLQYADELPTQAVAANAAKATATMRMIIVRSSFTPVASALRGSTYQIGVSERSLPPLQTVCQSRTLGRARSAKLVGLEDGEGG